VFGIFDVATHLPKNFLGTEEGVAQLVLQTLQLICAGAARAANNIVLEFRGSFLTTDTHSSEIATRVSCLFLFLLIYIYFLFFVPRICPLRRIAFGGIALNCSRFKDKLIGW